MSGCNYCICIHLNYFPCLYFDCITATILFSFPQMFIPNLDWHLNLSVDYCFDYAHNVVISLEGVIYP